MPVRKDVAGGGAEGAGAYEASLPNTRLAVSALATRAGRLNTPYTPMCRPVSAGGRTMCTERLQAPCDAALGEAHPSCEVRQHDVSSVVPQETVGAVC
jgi:hypothetical protein